LQSAPRVAALFSGTIMYAQVNWHGRPLIIDYAAGCSLAIPLDPHGPQPAFFAPAAMSAEPLRAGAFVGDVRQGGSCNAEWLHWAPHCHGTHTECIGHITAQRLTVADCIDSGPVLAVLATVCPAAGMIALAELQRRLPAGAGNAAALILRTEPNGPEKLHRDYATGPAFPVLEKEAMAWLATLPLRHLLLDTPSADAPDNPRLDNHRIWWGRDPCVRQHGHPPQRRSITELIYAAAEVADGEYWLHLELSPLLSDATPSRPLIYPVTTASSTTGPSDE
jgi:arylformamidase